MKFSFEDGSISEVIERVCMLRSDIKLFTIKFVEETED